jgi:hypothetical protein
MGSGAVVETGICAGGTGFGGIVTGETPSGAKGKVKVSAGMECVEGDPGDAYAAGVLDQTVIASGHQEDPTRRKYQTIQGSIHG